MAMQFSEEDKKAMENDNSEIYKKRDDKTNKEDIKNMSKKEKRQYFKQYYLGGIVGVIIVAVFLGLFLYDTFKKEPSAALYVAITGDAIDEEKEAQFKDEIEKYLNIDTEKEIVYIDSNLDRNKLQTYLYAGTVDVVIAGEDSFRQWAKGGYFREPGTSKDLAFYNNYSDNKKFFSKYISPEDVRESDDIQNVKPSDDTDYNFGLYISDKKYQEGLGGFVEKPVIGVSAAAKENDYIQMFIEYMMEK